MIDNLPLRTYVHPLVNKKTVPDHMVYVDETVDVA